jgi:hypothetical protein
MKKIRQRRKFDALTEALTVTDGMITDDFNDGYADGWVFPYYSGQSQGPCPRTSHNDSSLIWANRAFRVHEEVKERVTAINPND